MQHDMLLNEIKHRCVVLNADVPSYLGKAEFGSHSQPIGNLAPRPDYFRFTPLAEQP